MVEVMKIVVTSFKRSHARTAAFSVPDPAADTTDPRLHQRLLDTQGQVWVSFFGSLLLSLGSWCTQGFVCALQVLHKFWWLNGGLMVTSKEVYGIPRSAALRAPVLAAGHC